MAKYRSIAMVLTMLLLAATRGAASYEEVEDLVDIYTTDSNFIAVVDSRRIFNETIRARETIQWQGAQGEVGAFLTNERLLAVSTRSGQWNIQFLKIKEKKQRPQMLLGAQLVVMLTDDRIVGFGTQTGGFIQARLPLGEVVIASDIQGRVAAVITPDQAFALSARRRGVAEIRFRIQERFESMKTTYNKVTLRTSQRLITFAAGDAVWRDTELK